MEGKQQEKKERKPSLKILFLGPSVHKYRGFSIFFSEILCLPTLLLQFCTIINLLFNFIITVFIEKEEKICRAVTDDDESVVYSLV